MRPPRPDGGRIAFTALDRLWVADADGGNPRRLTRDDRSEHFPAWSPDGAWIALFHLGRRAGPPLQGAGRRRGRSGAADPRRRRLVPAGVGAGGPDRVGAGTRARLPDAGRGRRAGHRDRLGSRRSRGRRRVGGDPGRPLGPARLSSFHGRLGPHPPVQVSRRARLHPVGRDRREGARQGRRPDPGRIDRRVDADAHRDGAARGPGAGGDAAQRLHGDRAPAGRGPHHQRVQSGERGVSGPAADRPGGRIPGVERGRADRPLVAGQRLVLVRPRRGAGLRGAPGGRCGRGRGGGGGRTRGRRGGRKRGGRGAG